MGSAADALNLRITFLEFDVGDRFAKPEAGAQILRTDPAPDGAIFSVAFGQAEPLMRAAEERGIPFFLSGPLFPDELERLGGLPRRAYSNWIGYFAEDEEEKGYLLARELIKAAIERGAGASDGTIHVVGVGGDATWHGSALREEGLRRAVAEAPDAVLLQTVPTRWTRDEGREMAIRLLQRYPYARVVWAASDELALGVADGLRASGLEPGVTGFTGGLDLSLVGLQAVREGRLTATVAGTPLIWVQILSYLADYLCGVDFASLVGTGFIFGPRVAVQSSAQEFIDRRGQDQATGVLELSRGCTAGAITGDGSTGAPE